ncbi:MAG TPA: GNAT family N-acetyltransferase [Thermoanaerobaculia bacterium]|jgi:GNAT superfamily N-acetyltransferase|nr:GNAT family N-acetyltransferase [Thermoanaerobaculia bacterium]
MKTESPQVTVREACPEDLPFVEETAVRLAGFPLPAWRTPEEVVVGEARTLRRFVESGDTDSRLLVAEDAHGTLLGFIFLETEEDYFTLTRHGHVGILAVAEAAESQGIGRVLMQAAEAWGREQGFPKLTLNVFENNHHARKVYEHIGYSPETLKYVKPL